jgi:hypothetical protein
MNAPNPHVANTSDFLKLAQFADDNELGRRVVTEQLRDNIEPEGIHLCHHVVMLDDGSTMRTQWFVRLLDNDRNREMPEVKEKDGVLFQELELDCAPGMFLVLPRLLDLAAGLDPLDRTGVDE